MRICNAYKIKNFIRIEIIILINNLIRQYRRYEKFVYRDFLFTNTNYIFYITLIRCNKIFDEILIIY